MAKIQNDINLGKIRYKNNILYINKNSIIIPGVK